MKKAEKKQKNQRLSLVLLVSGIIIIMLMIILAVAGALIFLLSRIGALRWWLRTHDLISLIFFVIAVILIVAFILVYFSIRIPLKPVNKIINAMNKLAQGDYTPRLHFKGAFAKHPTIAEMTDSFNEMADELEHTELLRSDFINNFSHEFKTPIVSISGFSKLLLHGNLSEEEKTEYLKIIEEESGRLSQMATSVLTLTKVENQTILTSLSTFNLSEQIRNCVLLLERKWERKNLELDIDFDEFDIMANEELLKEVWINLLDNAIKFTPDYGEIKVSIEENPRYLTIRITNLGSEIPDEDRERIFHKFYQSDTSHSTEGNGIGLAVVKRVVDLHKGTVAVASASNKTTFKVMLPKK